MLAYRASVMHLAARLPAASLAAAAWGGLQDSVPRAGVISLHARVEGVRPDSWEDPSVVQVWFRGGANYIVPREDAGMFTLGSYPRDPEQAAAIERLTDAALQIAAGRTLRVAEISGALGLEPSTAIRATGRSGRVLIRWDARDIWLIPVPRPDIDVEDARRELARRFLHWLGPATDGDLARWTGVPRREAKVTWQAIERELAPVEVERTRRFLLAADLEALERAEPFEGIRLLPMDDPYTKLDQALLVPDPALRPKALPVIRHSPGYIPGAVLVDGEIVAGWQRQGRKVTIHPFEAGRIGSDVRRAIEAEALALPIAGPGEPSIRWD
ncbi:MAG: winged helix DNA-binding domain-containing protein [Chloroflexi bacterium]|nr:winged helix DNA-binding domain-containing protein [Chloroflexota bacterium]